MCSSRKRNDILTHHNMHEPLEQQAARCMSPLIGPAQNRQVLRDRKRIRVGEELGVGLRGSGGRWGGRGVEIDDNGYEASSWSDKRFWN